MIFRNFAESLIGSRIKARLLMHMLSGDSIHSERELSGRLGVSHMSVNRTMKEFHALNLVSPFRVGTSLSWKLNKQSYAYESLCDMRKMAANTPLEDLKKNVVEMFRSKIPPKVADEMKIIIFGSVAERREEAGSDIDLLVVTKNDDQKIMLSKLVEPLSQLCIVRYGNMLSSYIITEKESKLQPNSNILSDAESKGIVIL